MMPEMRFSVRQLPVHLRDAEAVEPLIAAHTRHPLAVQCRYPAVRFHLVKVDVVSLAKVHVQQRTGWTEDWRWLPRTSILWKCPAGSRFLSSEGYECWQAISVSLSERVVGMTLGNPAMIKAYEAGIPANGGWGYAAFDYDAASDSSSPVPKSAHRHGRTTSSAAHVPYCCKGKRLCVHRVRQAVSRRPGIVRPATAPDGRRMSIHRPRS